MTANITYLIALCVEDRVIYILRINHKSVVLICIYILYVIANIDISN